MWLLQGRFAEDSRQEVSKLLKYGQTYTLGRKIPADIVVDSKFVSRTSCHITVASEETIASQLDSMSDPLAFHSDVGLRPHVTIRFEANKSRKTFTVTQQPSTSRRFSSSEPMEVQVPADQEHVLADGDSFALTTTISLRLVWKPMVVCFAAKVKENAILPLRKAALQLGIHLSSAKSRWRDGYTHLCLVQVKPTESVLCALLQARPIISIEYFQELFRRAELPRHDSNSLETSFYELDYVTYQPTVDQQELSDLPDMPQKLLPDKRRTYMLKGTTCLFFSLSSEDAELAIYKSILGLAGARVFTHNPHAEKLQTKADFAQLLMPYKNSALSYWRNSGSKARSEAPDEGLVVLISAVHDHTPWKLACAIACTNLRIAMPSGFHAITNVVFSADVRAHLNSVPNVTDERDESALPPVAASLATPIPPTAQQANAANDVSIEPKGRRQSPPAEKQSRTEAEASPAALEAVQPLAASTEPPSTAGERQRRTLTRRTRKPAQNTEDAESHPISGPEVEQQRGSTEGGSRSTIKSVEPETSSSQLIRAERSGLTRRTGARCATSRRSDVFDALLGPKDATTAEAGERSGSMSGGADRLDTNNAEAGSNPKSRRYRMNLDEEDRAQGESMAPTQVSENRNTASQTNDAIAESSANKRKSPPQRQASGADQGRDMGEGARTSKRARNTVREEGKGDGTSRNQPHAAEQARIVRSDATKQAAGLSEGAQPDTEPQFLQALNTQRAKGKKMDEFDAEFNRLHIVKPGTQSGSGTLNNFVGPRSGRGAQQQKQTQGSACSGDIDQDYEAFKRMAEEDLRIHVRGNFVQVDFVPLVRQKKAPNHETQPSRPLNGTSADVPNFKKFRSKASGNALTKSTITKSDARSQVALVLPESNNYGLGHSYWEEKDGPSGVASETPTSLHGARSARTTARRGLGSDEEDGTNQGSRGKPATRGRVALDSASVERTAVDLDLDGLDSMDSADEGDMTAMLERRHGSGSQRAGPASTANVRGKKRPATLVQDSDEEMVSPPVASTAACRKKRATRAATMVIDDDDEESGDDGNDGDDGNFAGFGRSTSTRRRRDPPASGTSRARRAVF